MIRNRRKLTCSSKVLICARRGTKGLLSLLTSFKRSVTLDASARRFRAHRTYLQAAAAMRCINSRSSILQGQTITRAREQVLRQIDETLRVVSWLTGVRRYGKEQADQMIFVQELGNITNERVFDDLRAADEAQGRWLDEDPALGELLSRSSTL